MNRTVVLLASLLLGPASTPYAESAPEVPVEEAAPAGETPQSSPSSRSTLLEADNALLNAADVIERHLSDYPMVYSSEKAPAGALRLKDRDCVELALDNNARAGAARARVEAARSRIGQAKAERLPQLGGRLGWTHTEYNEYETPGWLEYLGMLSTSSGLNNTSSMGLGGATTGGMANTGGTANTGLGGGLGSGPLSRGFNIALSRYLESFAPQTVPDDTLVTSEFFIDQVLYTGGQLTAGIRASEFLAESEAWQEQALLADIEYQAKQAFYDAILADALVRVAEESVLTFDRTLTDAEEMFEVGMVSHFEVLRAQTELGARKAQLVAAHNGRKLAFAQLRRVLSIPQSTPIALDPARDWQPPAAPVEQYIRRALESRPELKALDQALSAAGQDLRRVKGSYLPQVGASAKYRNVDGGGVSMPDGWEFTVGAEWEIYSGGRRGHERAEKKAAIRQLEFERADLERLIELDVTQAHIQIQDAMAQVQSERGTVSLAQEGLRLAELRFQEGVGTQSEVLDAELALTNAESNLIKALRDFAVAMASLERATAQNWFPGILTP